MSRARESFERLFWAVMEMWGRRYDTETDDIPDTTEGEPFGCPVAVDLGQLAVAQSEALVFAHEVYPDLHAQYSGPPQPVTEGNPDGVVSLDEHRIRSEAEMDSELVLYLEGVWGKETVGFNVAIRDLEAMRRGTEEPGLPLRIPETDHEVIHAVLHIRALANDVARHFNLEHLVRESDDFAVGRKGEA
jgi:hypothetical protein